MRAKSLLLLILVLVSGCGESLQQKLVGKWAVDSQEALIEMMDVADHASDAKPKFTLEFDRGGVFRSSVTASGHTQEKSGRWFFVEAQGDVCTVEVSINSNNFNFKGDNVLTEIHFFDDDNIELVPPNMYGVEEKMSFQRIE